MNASDALQAIQELLDGTNWTPDTLNEIARILIAAGYQMRDANEINLPEQETKA